LDKKSIFPSLQITPPFGGVLLHAVLLMVVVWLCGEGIIRLGVMSNLWPEPLMGTANAELDIKIQALDQIVRNRPVDCIFLGSSQMDTAINPALFTEEYNNLTGQTLNCYNFSLGTLTAGPAGKIAAILVYRYHPKVLVAGLSARDFSRDFGELARPLTADPWVREKLADPNPGGWLTENSLFYRYLGQVRNALNPDYQQFRLRLLRELAPDGFLQYGGNDLTIDTTEFIPKFKLNADDLSGLDEVMAMKDQGVKVILLEVPVYPDFLPHYVEGDSVKYFTEFREAVQKRVDVYGVPFVYSQEDIGTFISGSRWNDVKHLNIKGAEIFSRWFAKRAADIIPAGMGEGISMRAYGDH
jgi:lysophospholipase L1-like esterase